MSKTLTIGSKSVAAIFFSNEFIIALLLFPYFKTSGFDFIPGLSNFCNAMLVIECIVFLGLNILERRTTKFSKLIILLMVWIFFLAPLISKAESPSFFYFTGALGIVSFFELGFSRNPKKLLNATCKVFTIMITLNALMLIVMPNGFIAEDGTSYYLFGLRTGFSLFIIPGILFNLIRDKYNNKISPLTIITFAMGAFSLFNKMVVTGILELLIIVILLVLLKKQKVAQKINFAWVAIVLFLLNISMTVLGSQNQLMNLISIAFNKDISLSGRTDIWAKVTDKLGNSPIAGVGKDATVTVGLTQRPAHNQWLHVAMEGGYVAMLILIVAVIFSFIYLYKNREAKWYTVLSICTIAILVASITEIQTYVPFFFVIFNLPYLLPRWDKHYQLVRVGYNEKKV
jgi:O-antigen ligase